MSDNYSTLRRGVSRSIYRKDNKLIPGEITGNMTGDILYFTQELLDIVNSSGISGIFLGFATPSTIPTSQAVNGFYFSSEPGVYPHFIGKNNTPIVITGSFEVIYCIEDNGNLIWTHEEIATDFEIDSITVADINNIIR